jgi:hypothetical protein
MYHSHHDEMTQIALGLTGLFVIHPRRPTRRVDRDFAIMLHEWRIDPGAKRPNPNEMIEFNMLTMNAKAFPGTAPLVVRNGQRVRVRIGNLSPMEHHPIHLHGHQFRITETDGGEIAESAQWPETTVLVPVGSTRTIEFVAAEPGDWAVCLTIGRSVASPPPAGPYGPHMPRFGLPCPQRVRRGLSGAAIPVVRGRSRLPPEQRWNGDLRRPDLMDPGIRLPRREREETGVRTFLLSHRCHWHNRQHGRLP